MPPLQYEPTGQLVPAAELLPEAQVYPGAHVHAPPQVLLVYSAAPADVPKQPAAHGVPPAVDVPAPQYVPATLHAVFVDMLLHQKPGGQGVPAAVEDPSAQYDPTVIVHAPEQLLVVYAGTKSEP